MSKRLPPNLRSPPRLFSFIPSKASLLLLSFLTFLIHVSLFSSLNRLYPDEEVLKEMEDRVRGEAWALALTCARIMAAGGIIVGFVGAWGALKDHLPSLRIFALHSFVSLFAATLFVSSLLFLAILPEHHEISQSFSQLLCNELTENEIFSHAEPSHDPSSKPPWFFDFDSDTLGWGIESCEERWRSTLGFGCLLVLIMIAALAHGVWVIWGYYRLLQVKQVWGINSDAAARTIHRRTRSRSRSMSGSGSSSNHGHGNRHRSRSTATDFSSSSDSSNTKQPRILLLPPGTDMKSIGASPLSQTPMFSITPASPEASRDSFPPPPHTSTSKSRHQEFVVYAPIPISLAEAMALNAKEAFVPSPESTPSSSSGTITGYFNSPPRQTAEPLTLSDLTPKRGNSLAGTQGRSRSDSAATIIAQSGRETSAELPRYDELQLEKRVY